MKIAFLIVSICLIVVVSSYDIEADKDRIEFTLLEVGQKNVPCSKVKKIVLENGIGDEATVSQIPEKPYRKCVKGVLGMMTKNQDVIDAVDKDTLTRTLNALREAALLQ